MKHFWIYMNFFYLLDLINTYKFSSNFYGHSVHELFIKSTSTVILTKKESKAHIFICLLCTGKIMFKIIPDNTVIFKKHIKNVYRTYFKHPD